MVRQSQARQRPFFRLVLAADFHIRDIHYFTVLQGLKEKHTSPITDAVTYDQQISRADEELTSSMRLTSVVSACTRWKLAIRATGRKPS